MTTEQMWLGYRPARAGLLLGALPRAVDRLRASRKSVVPNQFWYFSVGGGLTLLAYAIYRRDPVFILGQAAGLFVYARNLYFIHRTPAPAVS